MENPGGFNFKDLFSGHSSDYARYRPRYPRALFEYLSSLCERHELALDCGTGNGQAAVALSEFFARVLATDPSSQQLASAALNPRVEYRQARAEDSGLPAQSADLVTVAQALHWLRLPEFYAEVRRVLRPGSPLAVWCYELCSVTPEIDGIVQELYRDVLGSYWEKERALVEDGYRSAPFPFTEIEPPRFEMKTRWSLKHLVGYLGTWSALRKYVSVTGANPLEKLAPRLASAWGSPLEREISWPLSLRIGRTDAG